MEQRSKLGAAISPSRKLSRDNDDEVSMAKMKAVAESVLTGIVMAVFSYWLFITPATRAALQIRREHPDAWFSSMITWYAAFVVIGVSVILAAVASCLIYRHVAEGSQPQHDELPAMATDTAVQLLRTNVSKRVRVTFTDGVTQLIDIDWVDDEGFGHSGPSGIDPKGYWTRFEDVAKLEPISDSDSW